MKITRFWFWAEMLDLAGMALNPRNRLDRLIECYGNVPKQIGPRKVTIWGCLISILTKSKLMKFRR